MSADIIKIAPKRRAAGQTEKKKLTAKFIEKLKPRERRYRIADTATPGLYVSVATSGIRAYLVRGRIGRGRAARSVDVTIGSTDAIRLVDARNTATSYVAQMRIGEDPRKTRDVLRADASVDQYIHSLVRRKVKTAGQVQMVLVRAIKGLAATPVEQITRRDLVRVIDRIHDTVGPVAATTTQARLAAWLNWAVNRGDISASPLAGYRRERMTHAQIVAQEPKWTLMPDQVGAFWRATHQLSNLVFRDFMRILIVTGQRRTETSLMRWSDIEAEKWHMPAAIRKTGVAHDVPLGPISMDIINRQPRMAGIDLVFPGRGGLAMTGWSKRLPVLKKAMGEDRLAPHGLRRGYRTGLSELGIREAVAELQIGHARTGLVGIYDKSELWKERVDAQLQWEQFVSEAIQ